MYTVYVSLLRLVPLLALLVAAVTGVHPVGADSDTDPYPDDPNTTASGAFEGRHYVVTVSTRFSESGSPGNTADPRPPGDPGPPGNPKLGPGQGPRTSKCAARSWTVATGVYTRTTDCHTYYMTIPNISNSLYDWWQQQFDEHPGQTPYTLYIDDEFNGLVWIPDQVPQSNIRIRPDPNGNAAGPAVDPRGAALQLIRRVPLPDIRVKANPGVGLVNVPAWFWVEGYDGRPFGTAETISVSVPGGGSRSVSLSVEVRGGSYEWDFGDGTTETGSLGTAYPAESEVKHRYASSSLGRPQGFPLKLTVRYEAAYRVNGGPLQPLPPVTAEYTGAYPVQEAQSVLDGTP